MLSHAKEHESLAGKLLLSTALVAVTVAFGYWQAGVARQQQAAVMAAMMAASQPNPASQNLPPPVQPDPSHPVDIISNVSSATPDINAQANAMGANAATAAPDAPKSTQMAMASPQAATPATPQTVAPQANVMLPADAPKPMPPPTLTGMDAIRNFLPTEGVSPPLPTVTGTPDPGASPPIPAGTHLEDGDYTSDRVQFEWGDLRARIVVTGGKITGVQIVSYPDHRSQSLYLIQLADPILTTEVIKTQQSRVNTVSSATNSSIAFRDAIAGAIIKATR